MTPRSGPRTRSQTQAEQNLTPGSPGTPINGVRSRSQTMVDQNYQQEVLAHQSVVLGQGPKNKLIKIYLSKKSCNTKLWC
ncbi:short-chain dehydrogenase [Sesbania bispinosa]|nr:short-chain dehydrogenase [Sesbania bispinosa]